MSFRTARCPSNEETSLRYKSLLGPGQIEVAWERDDEPVTVRNPAAAERIAADFPIVLQNRAA